MKLTVYYITGHGTGANELEREKLAEFAIPRQAADFAAQWWREKGFQEEVIGWFNQVMHIEETVERPIQRNAEYKAIQYTGVGWIGLCIEQDNELPESENNEPESYVFSGF